MVKCVYNREVKTKVRCFVETYEERKMESKFTRNELQRLGCTEEEINLVMSYQKRLPIIFDNEDNIEKFCINARDLYKEIIQSDDMSHFSRWIKRALKNYRFEENLDFILISPNGRTKEFAQGGDTRSIDYIISVDMAKQLAMLDKKETGFIARRYFILMERIVKENKEWFGVRNPERKEYKEMCEMLSENIYRHSARTADRYDYSREANILNIIACGADAQSIRNYFGLGNQSQLTRDSLKKDYNEKLSFLQKQNRIYLGLDMPIVERVKLLIASFDVIYPTASPILPWMSREDMLKAREDLVNKLLR